LLVFQHRPGNGPNLALNAVLFTVYFGCGLHFLHTYWAKKTGAYVTIAGFLSWAGVFVLAPGIGALSPGTQLESGVWNLPKYLVAVGMILLLLEEQIEHNKYLALHDELTGLPNRRLFQDRLGSALERARRNGTRTALLLVDLDQFKQVNDTLGHHAGDQLLKHVGTVFSDRVRRSDTVARTGGDEFSVILDDPISREDAEGVGNSLIELLNTPLELGDQKVCVGASVGIAFFPEDASDCEGLCIAADLRMYEYKHRTGQIGDLARPPVSASLPSADAKSKSRHAG
jgi:diguanylate cyclase (GGDEF)-like protein